MEATQESYKEITSNITKNQEGVITILNAHLIDDNGEKVKLENLTERVSQLSIENTEKLRQLSKAK